MDIKFVNWAESMLDDFVDLGICYQDNSVAVTPIQLRKNMVEGWGSDLTKLFNLVRKIAIARRTEDMKPRADLQGIAESFINNKRIPGIMRPDGILVGDQLKILELNVESAVGGIWEIDFLVNRIKNNPLLNIPSTSYFPSPKDAFLKYINELAAICEDECKQLNLAFVGFSDYDRYNKDICYNLCNWITEHTKFTATYTTPEILYVKDGYITDGLRNYDVVYRYGALIYPSDRVADMVKLVQRCCGTKSILVNDPVDIYIDHKGILALLSQLAEENNPLVQEYIDLIKAYIPWTRFLHCESVNYRGKFTPLKELLYDAQNDLVLKRTNSCIGEHVFIGKELPAIDWRDLIDKILNDSTNNKWIVQENLSSKLYPLEYYSSSQGLQVKSRRCTFSPFMFGEHFGGAIVRVEHNPEKRVLALPTNSEMGLAAILLI